MLNCVLSPVPSPTPCFHFSTSCLYMKTYRVHRIFNSPSKLTRISITDRYIPTV